MESKQQQTETRAPDIYIYKCEREYFCEVLSGHKTFEIRLNDSGPFEGDIILLKEIDAQGEPTAREIAKRVGFVFNLNETTSFYSKEAIERYGINVYSLLDTTLDETCF